MKLLLILLISLVVYVSFIGHKPITVNQFEYCDSTKTEYNCSCKLLNKENAKFWKADSNGKTGFRYLLTPMLIQKCKLSKLKWTEVKDFFGLPNSELGNIYLDKSHVSILKYLIYFDEFSTEPESSNKTLFLDFVIDESNFNIINVTIRHGDG